MLFLLTGKIQTGKTRWLLSLADELARSGVVCSGVIAPGDWVDDGQGGFEKLGINNLLLPERRTIAFARRRDLAQQEGSFNAESTSAKAQLGWEISDDALAEVNDHFDKLAAGEGEGGVFGFAEAPELLIVDEFGRLELMRNEGLTSAISLVEGGAPASCACQGAAKHCLVIVREDLLPLAHERFAKAWGGCMEIAPNQEGKASIFNAFR